jgi:hypothetical protein
MSSSRLYVQLGYLLHLSSTTHKNAAAAGFANGPRTYYNYMIWGIPMGKYAQQQCHGMELKSHKKKVLSHLYPIFKPTMFVDFGVVDMFGWIKYYFGVTRSIQLIDSNVQLENHLPIREGLISHVCLVAKNGRSRCDEQPMQPHQVEPRVEAEQLPETSWCHYMWGTQW